MTKSLLSLIGIIIMILSFQSQAQYDVKKETVDSTVEWAEGLEITQRYYITKDDQRVRLFVLEVDLNTYDLRPLLFDDCYKISKMAPQTDAIATINGTFFSDDDGEPCKALNLTKVDGHLETHNNFRKRGTPALLIDKRGKVRIEIVHKNVDPRNAVHGIGGFPLLVRKGKIDVFPRGNYEFFQERDPRAAIGLTSDQRLFMVVVDGRSFFSAGLTIDELAGLMKSVGAITAMAFDGGGSAALWTLDHGIVNSPSDFWGERKVPNALGVFPKDSESF